MSKMQAIIITSPGDAETLAYVARPLPTLGHAEVMVQVASAGINRADILQRQGKYPPPPGAPVDIPGLEVAGTVIAVDEACTRMRVGDEVMALLAGGGYATHVVVPESHCLLVPKNIALRDAGALPEAMFTVWANLFVAARVQPGAIVLIHGGTSGIGSMAIQMLRAHGAVPIITAGDDDKCTWCRDIGAEHVINYHTQDFVAALQDITQGKGVDVVLDVVGGSYLPRNLAALAEHGRIVSIATQHGVTGELDIRMLMRRRAVITGTTLRGRSTAEKARLAREIERRVLPWLARGVVKPLISHHFPIKLAAEAHKMLESGAHRGKIALEIAA